MSKMTKKGIILELKCVTVSNIRERYIKLSRASVVKLVSKWYDSVSSHGFWLTICKPRKHDILIY